MSYPSENQLTSYRRTEEGLDMDPNRNPYSESRNGGTNSTRDRHGFDGGHETTTLLTPRDKAVIAAGPVADLPDVEIVTSETFHKSAPADRTSFVYIIMLIHGFGTLLPWNVIISSFGYWDFKLDPVNNRTTNPLPQYPTGDFFKHLTLANQFPNVFLNALNLLVTLGGTLTMRIVVSIAILVLVMVETLGLAIADSSQWTWTFVAVTLSFVVVLGTANGIYQNSLYGLAASFPPRYTNAIIIGNNFCGVLVALLSIMSISVFPGKEDQTKSGTLYFSCALFILLVAFGSYFLLPLSKFYRYYINRPTVPSERPSKMTFGERFSTLRRVFGLMRLECWNVFFVFFVTLSVFPNIMVNVQRYSMLDDEYFRPVITILNFSVFAFLGNLLPFACTAPGPRYLWIPVLARLVFFPFFLMCNYQEIGYDRKFAVWFANDYVYAVGGMLLAVTSGYFSSLAMMYASSKVKDSRLAPMAGQLAGFFLVLGIFSGLMFSWLLPLTVLAPTPTSSDAVTTAVPVDAIVSTLGTLFSSDVTTPSLPVI